MYFFDKQKSYVMYKNLPGLLLKIKCTERMSIRVPQKAGNF
jgi:hypothetical protein